MVPPLLSAASVLLLISQLLSAAIGKESCNNCELDYGEDYENASANEETHVPVSDPIKGAHSPPTKKPNGLESPPTKRPIRIPGSCYIPPKDGSKETSYLLIERVQSISVCARICAQTRGCIAFAYKASINQCRPSFSFSGNFVADASGGMQWSEMAPCDGANLKSKTSEPPLQSELSRRLSDSPSIVDHKDI